MATNFYLDNRTDKNGDAPIRVSITIRGSRFLTSAGFKISPAKWQANKQRVRQGASNAAGTPYNIINAQLAKITEHFANFEGECIAENYAPTSADLRRQFADNFGRKKAEAPALDFWGCFDAFVAEVSIANSWTKATHQKFNALRGHLTNAFPRLDFSMFDEPGFNRFVAYLRDKKQMLNPSINNQLNFLKWFLRWATAKGHNTNTAFQSYKPRFRQAQKKVIFLEWHELMRVYNYVVPKNGTEVTLTDADGREYVKVVHDAAAIAKTRDIFCFCCFTSLRYSDAANLRHSNIDGEAINITTVKTADTIRIELNDYAREILSRYPGTRGHVFPSITNQRMNVYLKELCELCEINQLITQTYYSGAKRIDETLPKYALMGTHSGRRTFICNALMLGIPAETVMKWTGHSDYKSMKPYIAIADSAKAQAMALFNKKPHSPQI